MTKFVYTCRLVFIIILVGICSHVKSQIYFKEYIDSEENCDEFNTQVFTKNDSIYLIDFISCDSSPYYTNILQFDSRGNYVKKLVIDDLVPNVYSGHLKGEDLFIAGVNNDENPDSKFIFWNGKIYLDSSNILQMDLFTPPVNVYLNSMGSIGTDSGKVIYGQYKLENNPKVFSFLLWLDHLLLRDSTMVFDTTYDWSIISDAALDSQKNLVVFIEASNVIDHIEHRYRIIQKFNSDKEKIFEWISRPFADIPGIGSFTIIDSSTVVMEFMAEENGNIHSLIAINQKGKLLWEHIFHIEDPYSLYRINDVITTSEGEILCCGTYRNVSQNIIETGYVCKLDRNGNLLWERIIYDQEELELPESGIKKVIHFNSIAESTNHSVVIGGRVIHKFLSPESSSEILFAVLDSNGCIYKDCAEFQDITRMGNFLSNEKTWTEAYSNDAAWSFKYTFDTIPIELGGNIYFELLRANSEFSEDWTSAGSLMRYDNGRVFVYRAGIDQIIYDFNLMEGDTFHMGSMFSTYDLVVEQIDTIVLLNGDQKKRWILQPVDPVDPFNDNTIFWIEGIGNLNGLMTNFLPWTFDAEDSKILCVYWMNNKVYDNPDIDSCWVMTTSTKEKRREDIIVVPNPATNEISIVGLPRDIESVKIYNYLGILVFQGKEDKIQLGGLPYGYYYIIVELNGAKSSRTGFVKM